MPMFRRFLEQRAGSIENPNVPLTGENLVAIFDGPPTDAGVQVSQKSALGITAVYRAVSLIASTAAALPLKVYKQDSREPGPGTVLDKPNPDATDFELWEYVYLSLLLWGNAYLQKERSGLNKVTALDPLSPSLVTVKRVGRTKANPAGKVFLIDGETKERTTDDILHIPGLSYDGLTGLSPIAVARQSLGLSMAAERFGAKLFGSGSLLSGVLTTDKALNQETSDRLKATWRQKMAGLGNAHEVAVLDSGTKFQPISIPPEDAQFLGSREFQVREIARLFGIPPHMLMDVNGSTSWGTGIEQQSIGFVVYTLGPWLKRVERRVSMSNLVPPRCYAEYLVDGLLRGDTLSRYQAYAIARRWGWMSINEVRAKENEPPIETGDNYLEPLNYGPAGQDTGGDTSGSSGNPNEPEPNPQGA